jgi:hypothetical protein
MTTGCWVYSGGAERTPGGTRHPVIVAIDRKGQMIQRGLRLCGETCHLPHRERPDTVSARLFELLGPMKETS